MLIVLKGIFILCSALIGYHLFVYPLIMQIIASLKKTIPTPKESQLNQFIFVIPMFNESLFIEQKIANIATLDYPRKNFSVLLLDDASTDNTVQVAQLAKEQYPQLDIVIQKFPMNRGKVALLNDVLSKLPAGVILFLSDVSSSFSTNILHRANAFFNDPKVGIFCPKYQFAVNALAGAKTYWNYQSSILFAESVLGAPMGYHGAGYAVRRDLWQQLPTSIINDDFVMPMQIIAKGYRGIYDLESSCLEMEQASMSMDWNRRLRIAKGNIQQVVYLKRLLLPSNGLRAWMYLSSKTLRIFLPWLFLGVLLSSFFLSFHYPKLFTPLVIIQLLFYFAGLFKWNVKPLAIASYFVRGQITILIGWFKFFQPQTHWTKASKINSSSFVHPLVRILKWMFDKIGALIGLGVFLLLLPIFAFLIKRASPGPIFYKQLRVGKTTAGCTHLFNLYKLRSMHIGADKSHLKWTLKDDPRVYSFGTFLRTTRLDEFPQFYNVLKGDMSLVGPRPEKPSLFPYIEKNIPFYAERLNGVLPGMTGWAQVSLGSDKHIEDVVKKVAFDHAYAMYLTKPWLWIKLDFVIIINTLKMVFTRREL